MGAAPGIIVEGEAWLGEAVLFPQLRLTLQAGRWTSLLGASGVGKTTLLRLIAGLETGAAFNGAVSASDGAALSGRIAFMGQSDLLAPWLDLLGNVTLGARLRGETPDRERARAIIASVGLAGFEERRPQTLSGGQRQRAVAGPHADGGPAGRAARRTVLLARCAHAGGDAGAGGREAAGPHHAAGDA